MDSPMDLNWLGSRSNVDIVEEAADTSPSPPLKEESHVVLVNSSRPPGSPEPSGEQLRVLSECNRIRTSKYTVVSFLPKNLFEQFRSIANFYFLSLVVIQIFPPFNNVSPILTAAPIVIIVVVTAIKDAVEDWKRHQADKERKDPETFDSSNGAPCWQSTSWEDVKVGDLVLLRNNDRIPADIVILSSSEPDCICCVETKNLDGETNLKVRRGAKNFANLDSPAACTRVRLEIASEMPNANLYSYTGVLRIHGVNGTVSENVPLGINNILLRGCVLRHTDWCVGVAIYAGRYSKLMLNSGATPSKRSRIDRLLNPLVLINFLLLGAVCVICTAIASIYTGVFLFEDATYVPKDSTFTPLYTAFFTFFNCMIIFQSIIPIALYISVEISKTAQSYMLSLDEDMCDSETKTYMQPRAWNLCDDLGQIEYIFSDKTGTLTCNVMEFRKCSINGIMYGDSLFEEPGNPVKDQRESRKGDGIEKMKHALQYLYKNPYMSPDLPFVDKNVVYHLSQNGDQARKIREFFTLLAVCHTVLVSRASEENPFAVTYNAQSPDEAALVAVARDMGFTFLRRVDNVLELDLMGELRRYEVLHVLEFNSDRKRMSVVVRRPEGQIILLVKGADSVIFERLRTRGGPFDPPEFYDVTARHLEMFAGEGLRTLCLAYRVVSEEEYVAWARELRDAQTALVNREQRVDAVAARIENDLTLMGATAIEDKLQEGVPQTIKLLREAGLKIWVLTGDKMETAINIGFACNLLTRNMILIVVNSSSRRTTYEQLLQALETFWDVDGNPKDQTPRALVIDGSSLKFALRRTCRPLLLELGCRCRAVICCRVSPLQKAKVVSLVRRGLGAVSLSVGDGANDVSMIQEADIAGIIDQDIDQDTAMKVAPLYFPGLAGTIFTAEGFWLQMADALWHSLVIYYTVRFTVADSITSPIGVTDGKDSAGTLLAFTAIFVVNVYNSAGITYWCWITFSALFASLAIWSAYLVIFLATPDSTSFGQLDVTLREPSFYLVFFLAFVASFLPRLIICYLQQLTNPTDVDILREGRAIKEHLDNRALLTETSHSTSGTSDLEHPPRSAEDDSDGEAGSESDAAALRYQLRRISTESENDLSGLDTPTDDTAEGRSPVAGNPDGFVPRAADNLPSSGGSGAEVTLTSAPSSAGPHTRRRSGTAAAAAAAGAQLVRLGSRAHAFLRRVPAHLGLGLSRAGSTRRGGGAGGVGTLGRSARAVSIVFMGTHEQLPNTGFAFSHDGGMGEVITPSSAGSPPQLPSPSHISPVGENETEKSTAA
ncbi:hypothetical protein HK405_004417 [Cladochytrium tenue]|nr:hypothetical protein HK405_004417 [Cladochytrium tenue]